jgi:hypothetical protein
MTRRDNRLAKLAYAWKQTFTKAKQAVKQAKYEYQSQRGDLLHEVLLRNGGNREEAKAWAIEHGSSEREAERLLKLEAELYAPYVPRPRKTTRKRK